MRMTIFKRVYDVTPKTFKAVNVINYMDEARKLIIAGKK